MTIFPLSSAGAALSAGQAPALGAAAPTLIVAAGTSASALQRIIDTAEAGTTIRLAAGNFNFDRTIRIDRDNISVVGAGSDSTFITMPRTLGAEAFSVGDQHMSGSFTLSQSAAEGATSITLTGAHSFAAGDFIYLARDSTTAFYDEIGDGTWRNTDVPLRTSIVQVESVNGSTITLTSGLHFEFVPGETTVREIGMAENVRLGGFSVDYNLGTSDPSDFRNTLGIYDRNAVIEVEGTAGLNLFDIVAHDVPSIGVNVALSYGMAANGIEITGAHNRGDGGNGYALQIRDVYESSFMNMSDQDMRHSIVFASWRSAANNRVHVTQTDRDINFHGGRDHGNVVMVDRSIRDANSDIIGPTLFINTEGTHYGTVTDADANLVRFGTVVGSRLADNVTGYDGGSWLDGRGGHDSLTGGSGNDMLIGGSGRDSLSGGAGVDIADYTGRRADFRVTEVSSGVFDVADTRGDQSIDRVSGVEWLTFDDGVIRLSDMAALTLQAVDGVYRGAATYSGSPPASGEAPSPVTPTPVPTLTGTSGKDVFNVTVAGTIVNGLGDWDEVRSSVDFVVPDDVERLELIGTAAITGVGRSAADQMFGNEAANALHGMEGKDRLWGRGGNDQLFGGGDKDDLRGGEGNDLIDGGAGQDKLTGNAGADTFRFVAVADSGRGKHDRITDFQHDTDTIDLRQIDADTTRSGDQAFVFSAGAGDAGALWHYQGYIYGDTNGDRVADLSIWVGNGPVDAGDMLL